MTNSIAIVTPLYKTAPSVNELASLAHSFDVLEKRKRFIVAPDNLNFSEYKDVLNGCEIIRLKAEYFKNVAAYNRLMLSKYFYRLFDAFDYILLYQPDALVYRDELDKWCERGYDYVGAPWPGGLNIRPYLFRTLNLKNRDMLWLNKPIRKYVGNGGLSLRKVSTALKVLDKHWLIARAWDKHEDLFWAFYARKIPGEKEASMFSLEREPSTYYKSNDNQLPFGCHAWEIYEPEFWRTQFKKEGFSLLLNV